jgi:hypothetical protein
MSRGVLDTSVLIATDISPLPGELAISVVSLAELHFGVLIATDEDARALRLARLSSLLRRFDPLPVDESVSASYGRLAARVAAVADGPHPDSGRAAGALQLLIAATAHAHGACLFTRRPAEYEALGELLEVVPL